MRRPVIAANKRVCMKQYAMQQWSQVKQEQEEPRWLTHYCSNHQIMLVGEGDFSFSLCLAKAFGSASNIVASSLDTYGYVIKKYKNAKSNLDELQKLGACLLHGVDATKMKFYPDLKIRRFDRIIFNFPHAGFHGKEDKLALIKMHRDLVFGFFKNASGMLRANGEIHVNHKTTYPYDCWGIEKLATQSFLITIEITDFTKEDYPGYNNKRGDGGKCDEPFPLGECSTFKFINNPRLLRRNHHMEVPRKQTILPFQEVQNLEQLLAPVNCCFYRQKYMPRDYFNNVPYMPRDYFNNVPEMDGRVACFDRDVTLDSRRLLPSMEPLQSLQPWPPSTNCRYSLRQTMDVNPHRKTMDVDPLDPFRRTMDVDPLRRAMDVGPLDPFRRTMDVNPLRRTMDVDPLRRAMDVSPLMDFEPLGARNEGYQYHVSDVSSRYLHCRIASEAKLF